MLGILFEELYHNLLFYYIFAKHCDSDSYILSGSQDVYLTLWENAKHLSKVGLYIPSISNTWMF